MDIHKIAIIGGGNIGLAMALGLVKSKALPLNDLIVTRRRVERLDELKTAGVSTQADNCDAVQKSDVIVLAVKPYMAAQILTEIKPFLDKTRHCIVSMVTGLTVDEIHEIVGEDIIICRAMPNTAMAFCESMTCISYSKNTNADIRKQITTLFETIGEVADIDEGLQEASTILGAAGIAFALRYIRAATQGGIEIGFSADVAQQIVAQTTKGAVTLLQQRKEHPEREIDRVTTPRGVTISGLNEMEHRGFSSALIKGLVASYRKIEKIK